jgi:uncharacterized FlaG/YvyC family protein
MTLSPVTSGSVTTASGEEARIAVQTTPSAPAQKSAGAGAGVSTQTPSPEHIAQAVDQVNAALSQKGHSLKASIEKDKTTGIDIVKFRDTNTNEVISQYPSKAVIAIAEAIDQSLEAKGRLINIRT